MNQQQQQSQQGQQQQQQPQSQPQMNDDQNRSAKEEDDDSQSNEGFVVKMRGLPWSATADDIIKFLSILGIFETIYLLNKTVNNATVCSFRI